MKNFVLFFLLSFSIEGVFGETLSVIDGDSVTLHTGLTKIQENDVLDWMFGAGRDRIVRARKDSDRKYDDVLDGRFRDRLKLDRQTGDLTITNITTEHAGLYEIYDSIETITLRTFTVNVVSAVKSASVIVGDSVTLNSSTNIQRDDVIEWRFADLNSPIAEHNIKTGIFSTSDGPDGIFRHRLQLNYSTGSLTIRNIGTNHSGLYEAVIRKNSSSGYTIHKSYSVTVRGERKPALSVKKGESVTLHTDLTDIHTDDLMLWMFKNTVIADINKAVDRFNTSDGRFKDRLKLDKKTGSLTISNTRTEDSGLYELKIISRRFSINKRITVTVSGERKSALSVMKGDSVTLHTDLTEIHTDDVMLWMFEDTVIAEINKADDLFNTSDDVLDGRFRDRLKLDHQTGSLTITDIRNTDYGLYELKIFSSSRFTIDKRITVTVSDLSQGEIAGIVVSVLLACAVVAAGVIYYRRKISKQIQAPTTLSVMEGECVPLIPYGTDIPEDEDILWKFGGDVIAERNRADQKIIVYHDNVLGGKFKGQLELDKGSGTLIINDIKTTHSGQYELCSSRSGNTSLKTFRVSVSDKITIEKVSVKEGESVTLSSGVTGIQKDDEILWKFGLVETPIAQITDGTKKISRFAAGWRFIFRLKLDHQTGSLTITKTKIKHTGFYVLYIFKSGETSMKSFKVKVFDPTDNSKDSEENIGTINKPEEVPLRSV